MPESFKHFLETLQQAPTQTADQGGEEEARARRSRILEVLSRSGGPMTVDQLRSESALEFTEFATAVKTFVDAGLVKMTGEPGNEVVALTDAGAALAALGA